MKKQIILLGTLLLCGLAFSQVGINTETPKSTLDVAGKAADTSSLDGITAPRLTGNQLRAKTYTTDQTGTLVYITAADSAPAGQTVNVTSAGYYYFDGTLWQIVKSSSSASTNIYTANGSLTSTRTLTLSGYQLNFNGTDRTTYWDTAGRIHQRATNPSSDAAMGFHGGNANLWIQQWPNASSAITASGTSTSLDLATHFTAASAPITLSTSVGSNTSSVERMRITGEGNVGINTTDPTEKLDNNGITRLRTLPLNGATNAINTTSTGNPSSAQDQTFTATRTVVADANGVLGTVAGIPTDIGTSRVIVNVNVPGTQNLKDQFSPPAIAEFTDESIDPYNAWTNNVFTVPVGLGGLYIMVMQNSNQHVPTGATPTFSVIALYEKSTDGGTTWNTILRHTVADLAGTVVDNGNTLYWTGFLNAGDKIRLRFNCNTNTDNIVRVGGLSITKLAQ